MDRLAPLVPVIAAVAFSWSAAEAQDPVDWRKDWAVSEGYRVEVDTEGYEFPTAVAVVPDPGPEASDPLYFVAELRGTVKVVTNDRSVHTFAEGFFTLRPSGELPEYQGETGMAGICLAPSRGYVFVTYTYHDDEGVLRNGITRFSAREGVFSRSPTSRTHIREPFAGDRSYLSHQIGSCQVEGDRLYVSVGDGMQVFESDNLDSTLGKVLRMTLDGDPAPGNPFSSPGDTAGPRDYVWAYGFRNPFSLEVVDGRVFVADNGLSVDRFLEVRAGEDYLWDGTDWSIGVNADAVLKPSPGPVQMEYVPAGAEGLPDDATGRFYVAMSGLPSREGPPDRPGAKGVVTIRYDLDRRRLDEVPASFLRFRGSGYQSVTGVGYGPDGALYVVPLFPDRRGRSVVLRITHDPENAHPHLVVDRDAEQLLARRGCYGCHALGGQRQSDVGPPLDRDSLVPRLRERLSSEDYLRYLAKLDTVQEGPVAAYRDERRAVREAEGLERVRLWVRYKLEEPRFANPGAAMPDLGLTAGEARSLAEYLVSEPESPSTVERIKGVLRSVLPTPTYRNLVLLFAAGFLIAAAAIAGLLYLRRRRRAA